MPTKKLIGIDENQVPLNRDLGSMAYQDRAGVNITGGTAVLTGGLINNTQIGTTTPSTGSLSTGIIRTLNLQGGNNLFQRSQEFENAYWTKGGCTVTANATTAPDGTITADLINITAVFGGVFVNVPTTSGLQYTISFYAKVNSGTNTYNVWNDISGSSIGTYTPTTEWARYSFTFSATSSSATLWVVQDRNVSGYGSLFLWQAQLEIGVIASAPTVTTTAAITTTNNINVPSGQILFYSATKTAPSIAFLQSNIGLYSRATNFLMFGVGGNESMYLNQAGALNLGGSAASLGFGSSSLDLTGSDLVIARDAANILGQRNGTAAQTFRVYNTFTDASNYERLGSNWSSNLATIGTENAGTGVARALAFSTGNTERMRIPAAGGVQAVTCVSVGNATPATSGSGITFPATQSASSDANTLDDYEEGTWTPIVAFGGNSVGVTYYNQTAVYTRIGRTVTVQGQLYIQSKGSSTGVFEIRGLPFTANSANSPATFPLSPIDNITYTGTLVAYINPNEARVSIMSYSGSGSGTNLTNTAVNNDSRVYFCCTYSAN